MLLGWAFGVNMPLLCDPQASRVIAFTNSQTMVYRSPNHSRRRIDVIPVFLPTPGAKPNGRPGTGGFMSKDFLPAAATRFEA